MFDFLKKKLKLFEKNIEAEIESELKKEEKKEQKLQMEPQKQIVQTPTPTKSVEIPPAAPVIQKEKEPVVTRKRALRIQKPISE
ncbi:MAG TPA: signal recognition particle-docking protein FtsY, partial [Candidatus Thermoplasmatota archaeon]|nr:signal recognition particle-docking protein FtsY [Candidatus Thermoplasmatota archaeon]